MQMHHEIVAVLKSLGVREGMMLLVHSSLKSLGPIPGGPETVIQSLLEALGDRGTLLRPTLSYAAVKQAPRFDVPPTPSCVGAIPEHFRPRPGSLRSLHPTPPICPPGPAAKALLADHHL